MKSKATRKRSTSKSKGSAKQVATKKAASKYKVAAKKGRTPMSLSLGAGATAPVVYQRLRDRIAAVDTNVGSTENLSDFLKNTGW